jgi:hypothetical protein
MKALRWIADRLKDLLYDPTNTHLDPGRCIAMASLLSLIGAATWNMHLRLEIKLNEFGLGLSGVLTALVVYIYHDRKDSNASQ